MKPVGIYVFILLASINVNFTSYAEQVITSFKINQAPLIDGHGNDKAWLEAQEFTTHDEVAKIDITLKSVYTAEEIFFLVSFPDKEASVTHRSWVWNEEDEMYEGGPDREDVFVFKWNMEVFPVDLSLRADNNYMTDIWFWKANRTNLSGYADDKHHIFSSRKEPKSYPAKSRTGKNMYLLRKGDKGGPAYKINIYVEYIEDIMPCYTSRIPTGSRADIRAKGIWFDGKWVIEFSRALNTGNEDDILFDPLGSYLFGVSRYEIAGRPVNPESEQPFYGSGDIGEMLHLRFER